MIRINLLPVELRRGNRLAAKVIVSAFAAALAVSASVGWFGVVWFGQLAAAETELAGVEQKLAEQQQRASYHDQLQKNRTDYTQRVQTIQDIGKSRRLWSRFLDELIDVVNQNNDPDRHLAWFSRMQVSQTAKGMVRIDLPANVQDKDSSRVANLREDLLHAPFAGELVAVSDPAWTVVETKERTPPWSLSYPLSLELAAQAAATKK